MLTTPDEILNDLISQAIGVENLLNRLDEAQSVDADESNEEKIAEAREHLENLQATLESIVP